MSARASTRAWKWRWAKQLSGQPLQRCRAVRHALTAGRQSGLGGRGAPAYGTPAGLSLVSVVMGSTASFTAVPPFPEPCLVHVTFLYRNTTKTAVLVHDNQSGNAVRPIWTWFETLDSWFEAIETISFGLFCHATKQCISFLVLSSMIFMQDLSCVPASYVCMACFFE